MNKNIIELWDKHKDSLREVIKNTKQENYDCYEKLVKLITIYILNGNKDDYHSPKYDPEKITTIDNGDWQGTQIFLIPQDAYQPSASEYLVAYTFYGSCSGCDTLEGIRCYNDELPSEQQIDDYMTLCLHLIQSMKPLFESDEVLDW